jgi:uncharacterized protein VirK/YbjX
MVAAYRKGPLSALLRLILICRIFIFPRLLQKYLRLGIWRKLACKTRKHDPFYFLQHKFYLSRRFTVKQRIESAITHHEYESRRYSVNYDHQVYRADGIRLWAQEVDGQRFYMTLTGSEDNRNEGELSIVLSVDEYKLWRISFSYVCGTTFSLKKRIFLLLSRNQSERVDKKLFYECFAQNQPKLFCLAAICGVAQANGWDNFLAIRHDQQIAYDKVLESGFYNSYTSLWKQFAAREIDGHVYEVAAPLKIPPLNAVSRSHRARARVRREFWDSISRSSCAALLDYSRH